MNQETERALLDELRALLNGTKRVSRTILNNCIALVSREQVGLAKYGTALCDGKYTRRQLMQHAREEALDLANYLEAEIHTQDVLARNYRELRIFIGNLASSTASEETLRDSLKAILKICPEVPES